MKKILLSICVVSAIAAAACVHTEKTDAAGMTPYRLSYTPDETPKIREDVRVKNQTSKVKASSDVAGFSLGAGVTVYVLLLAAGALGLPLLLAGGIWLAAVGVQAKAALALTISGAVMAAPAALLLLGELIAPVLEKTERRKETAPLVQAIRKADKAGVQKLLTEGADVNKTFGNGIPSSPLTEACGRLYDKTIEEQADKETQDLREIVRLLVQYGAHLDEPVSGYPYVVTPLKQSIERGKDGGACMKLLLELGADPNYTYHEDDPPLLIAVMYNPGCANTLVDAGADVNRTLFAFCKKYPDSFRLPAEQLPSVLHSLFGLGADKNAEDTDGRRAYDMMRQTLAQKKRSDGDEIERCYKNPADREKRAAYYGETYAVYEAMLEQLR